MFRALVFLILVTAPAASQQVFVVDASGGPGSEFTSLPDAAAAADDGDILLLRAGVYAGVSLVGKGLTISADLDAQVDLISGVSIDGLPATSSLVLRGIDILGDGTPAVDGALCAGTIWIESCRLRGTPAGPSTNARIAARFDACPSVVIVRTIQRGGAPGSFPVNWGSHALSLSNNSHASIFEGTLVGSSGTFNDDLGGFGGNGAVLAQGSSLYAQDSSFVGGDGGGADSDFDFICQCFQCGIPGSGGSGIAGSDAVVTLLACSSVPGLGGNTSVPSDCFAGTPGQEFQLGGSELTQLAGPSHGLRITPVLREGDAAQLQFFGHPGEFVSLVMGVSGPPFFAGGVVTPVLLDLPSLVLVPLLAVPVGGVLVLPATIPALPPGLDGLVLHSQALFTAGGQKYLSNGTASVLLDGSL